MIIVLPSFGVERLKVAEELVIISWRVGPLFIIGVLRRHPIKDGHRDANSLATERELGHELVQLQLTKRFRRFHRNLKRGIRWSSKSLLRLIGGGGIVPSSTRFSPGVATYHRALQTLRNG